MKVRRINSNSEREVFRLIYSSTAALRGIAYL